MDNANGPGVGIENRNRVQVGLQAKRFQHLRNRAIGRHGRLLDEQGAEVAGFLAEGRLHFRLGQHFVDILRRQLHRTSEQVALNQIDAHAGEHDQLLLQFDAFGDDLGS